MAKHKLKHTPPQTKEVNMSAPSKLSNLTRTEKAIKDQQNSDEKDAAKAGNEKNNKADKAEMQNEGGKS